MGARTEQGALRPPLLLMTARTAAELPTSGGRWAFEPKMDGFRCAAYRQPRGKVTLHSRQQRPLTRYFPEVVEALQDQLIGGVVLDGELVVCTDGRLDFAALQRRLHTGRARRFTAEAPACLVVFDILAVGVDDLRGLPYVQRRSLVSDLLAAVAPPLALMPMTLEQAGARTWLTDHTTAGIEGVVVKHLTHAYRAARRTWQKVRTRVTARQTQAPSGLTPRTHNTVASTVRSA